MVFYPIFIYVYKKSYLGFHFAKKKNVTNGFPFRQAIMSGALASYPCRYSAHGL